MSFFSIVFLGFCVNGDSFRDIFPTSEMHVEGRYASIWQIATGDQKRGVKNRMIVSRQRASEAMHLLIHCINLNLAITRNLFDWNDCTRPLTTTVKKVVRIPEIFGNSVRRPIGPIIDGIRSGTLGKQKHFSSPQCTLRAKQQRRRKHRLTKTGVQRSGIRTMCSFVKPVVP